MALSSPHNERLKQLRKLERRRYRDQVGQFIAEGEDLLAAADEAGWRPLERYCAEGSGLPGTEVESELLAQVSQLGSGTRALAVYQQRWSEPSGHLCLAAWGVRDPGNIGTILRSAQAFGASCVALGPGTADPYSFKAVRASMGSIFQMPLARFTSIDELKGQRVALVPRSGTTLRELQLLGGEVTLVVGGEREGLPDEVIKACDSTASIPIVTESLNAAMAATIALYEVSS